MGDAILPFDILRDEDIFKLSAQGTAFRLSPNAIPTSAEVSFVYSKRKSALSELDKLHLDLAILKKRQVQLLTCITVCDAVLAPHKKLPPELLSKIFCFVSPHSAMFPLDKDMRLQLTQVCSRWRQIAFDTPTLWNLRFPPFCENSRFIELGASWWSQCSGSFLKLTTTRRLINLSASRSHCPLIDKLVLPFSNRLRKIQMRISVGDLANMLSAPPGSYKNLEMLALKVDGKRTEPWGERHSALLSSSKLNTVILSISWDSWFEPTLPWEILTRLTLISRIPANACLIILSKCSSLTICNFSIIDDLDYQSVGQHDVLPNLPLSLPLLEEFSVQFRSGGFPPFLSHLVLPSLSKFVIATSVVPPEHNWTQGCEAFFKAAGQSLQHIEIKSTIDTLSNVDDMICLGFPNVRFFIASLNYRFKPSTMEKIGCGEILPRVESLRFHAEHTSDVADMLHERQLRASSSGGAISPIKIITVTCCHSDSAEERLNTLRSHGIEINHIIAFWGPNSDSD